MSLETSLTFLTNNVKRILIFDTRGGQGLRGLRGNLSCDCLFVKAKHWKNKTKSNTKKNISTFKILLMTLKHLLIYFSTGRTNFCASDSHQGMLAVLQPLNPMMKNVFFYCLGGGFKALGEF